MTNAELARVGYEAAARGELDRIAELLAPDVKWHAGDPSAVGTCQNREQALHYMRQAAKRGGIGELVDVVDAGERVVVIMRRPTGRPGAALVANVSRFVDGRVVEMVHYPDAADALAAVGAA